MDFLVDEVVVVTNKVRVAYLLLFKTHQHVLDWHKTQAEYLRQPTIALGTCCI